MKKSPTYDWDWLVSHAPFKKIITECCDLDVKKKVQRFAVCCGIWDTSNEYEITVSLKKFEDNFEEIKARLLNTNVCKKSEEVFDYINEMKCSKRELCFLITDGCIANCEGKLTWHWSE